MADVGWASKDDGALFVPSHPATLDGYNATCQRGVQCDSGAFRRSSWSLLHACMSLSALNKEI